VIPVLPKVVTSDFPPAVKAQIDAALTGAYAAPNDAGATGLLGMVLQAYQQLDVAETCYRRAHLMDPKMFSWAYYLVVVEETRGEISNAIDDARAAIKLDPTSRPARMHLADSLLSSHEYVESRKLYEKLIQEEPDRALYYYGLGKVLAGQGSTVFDAIPQLKKAIELSPNFAAAHYQLALVYRQTHDLDQYNRELVVYRKDLGNAPPDDALIAQVKALNRTGSSNLLRPEEIIRQLQSAIADNPNDEIAHADLVKEYWLLKQYDKAEEQYQEAQRLNPNTAPDYIFGEIMLERKRYTEAGDAFRRAVANNPKDIDAALGLGRVYEGQRDLGNAIDQYQSAVTSAPDSREANGLLGEALMKKNQFQPAIDHLLKSLPPESEQQRPDAQTSEYLQKLGDAYAQIGNQTKSSYYLRLAGPMATTSASGSARPTDSSPGR
jgi:tetratricopeptide (TPR) repeat protein